MSSTRDDFALLLEAPDPVEADLVKDLLASEGIPSLLAGQDRVLAGLGFNSIPRPDLFVPRAALDRAREVIRDSRDGSSLTDELALAYPVVEESLQPSRSRSLAWSLFVGLVVVAFILTYARYFWPRSVGPLFE